MSAIENFKQLKSDLESLKNLTSITIQQGQHAPNSPANNFVMPELSGSNLAVIIKYLNDNQAVILNLVRKAKRAEIEAVRPGAVAEAEQFKAANSTPEAIV